MMKVIESVCNGPIRFISNGLLKPGLVVDLALDGSPSVVKSGGDRPFGIVEEVNGPYGMVSVWFETMIFRTDVFEKRGSYSLGTPLFVSKNGKLTSKPKTDNSYLVGRVILLEDNWMEVSWI